MRASASSWVRQSTTWQYASLLWGAMPSRVVLAITLMVALALTEGVGLLLLLPLLQLVGLNTEQGATGNITPYIESFFTFAGFPITLVSVLAVYVVIMSLYALLTRWQHNTSYTITYELESLMRQRLYNAIINTAWLFFSRQRASTFTHALTAETERVGTGTQQLLQLAVSLVLVFVYLFIAWQLSAVMTGAVVVCGIIMLLVLRSNVSLARAKGAAVSVDTRELYGAVTEHLDGMKTVKSYGTQHQNAALFSTINERMTRTYIDTVRNWSDTRSLFDIGSVLILGASLVVLIEVLHVPGAIALLLLFLFYRIIPQFSSMQQSYQYFINMLPSFANIMAIQKRCEAAVEREMDDPQEVNLQKRIEFRDVSFAYDDNGQVVLDKVNLVVNAGETTAIVGVSGAGKSTIADLVMGLIMPSDGKVLIDDVPLDDKRLFAWRRRIGYVAQDTFLFNDTVRANLLWAFPKATNKELYQALQVAAAEGFVTHLPDGIETVLGDRGVRLSGGERQRLALARALLRQPTVLLLDEATSSLDSENEQRIQDAIDALHGDMTIVIITHRLSTIRNADIIYVLEDGRIVESGDWATLARKENGRLNELRQIQGVV